MDATQGNTDVEFRKSLELHRQRYLEEFGSIRVLGDGNEVISRCSYLQRTLIAEDQQRGRVDPIREQDMIAQLLARSGKSICVIGDGGAGKTEFCRNVTYALAAAMDPADPAARVPVYVALGDLSLSGQSPGILRQMIHSLPYFHETLSETQYDRLAAEERLVYVLDGVDELLADPKTFDLGLSGLMKPGSSGISPVVILASRPGALGHYAKQLFPDSVKYWLTPLGWIAISRYVSDFFSVSNPRLGRKLLAELVKSSPELLRLLELPFMLALVCVGARDDRPLPAVPAKLMEHALHNLLQREALQMGSIENGLNALGRLARAAFEPEFKCLVSGENPGELELGVPEAEQVIVDCCSQATGQPTPEQLLKRLSLHSGVVYARGTKGHRVIQFRNRIIAEYLAGRHLARTEGDDFIRAFYSEQVWNDRTSRVLMWLIHELWQSRGDLAAGVCAWLIGHLDARDDNGLPLILGRLGKKQRDVKTWQDRDDLQRRLLRKLLDALAGATDAVLQEQSAILDSPAALAEQVRRCTKYNMVDEVRRLPQSIRDGFSRAVMAELSAASASSASSFDRQLIVSILPRFVSEADASAVCSIILRWLDAKTDSGLVEKVTYAFTALSPRGCGWGRDLLLANLQIAKNWYTTLALAKALLWTSPADADVICNMLPVLETLITENSFTDLADALISASPASAETARAALLPMLNDPACNTREIAIALSALSPAPKIVPHNMPPEYPVTHDNPYGVGTSRRNLPPISPNEAEAIRKVLLAKTTDPTATDALVAVAEALALISPTDALLARDILVARLANTTDQYEARAIILALCEVAAGDPFARDAILSMLNTMADSPSAQYITGCLLHQWPLDQVTRDAILARLEIAPNLHNARVLASVWPGKTPERLKVLLSNVATGAHPKESRPTSILSPAPAPQVREPERDELMAQLKLAPESHGDFERFWEIFPGDAAMCRAILEFAPRDVQTLLPRDWCVIVGPWGELDNYATRMKWRNQPGVVLGKISTRHAEPAIQVAASDNPQQEKRQRDAIKASVNEPAFLFAPCKSLRPGLDADLWPRHVGGLDELYTSLTKKRLTLAKCLKSMMLLRTYRFTANDPHDAFKKNDGEEAAYAQLKVLHERWGGGKFADWPYEGKFVKVRSWLAYRSRLANLPRNILWPRAERELRELHEALVIDFRRKKSDSLEPLNRPSSAITEGESYGRGD